MNHYIYAHLEKGEPVYIGFGLAGRAWMSDSGRTEEHRKWMHQQLPENLNVQIIATNLEANEARTLENILINSIKPRYNSHIGKQLTDGETTYHSVKQAANIHEVSVSCIKGRCDRQKDKWKWL